MSEPKQLLIIDDDPDFVAGIKAILVKAKYAVDVAHNPKDGFAALKAKNYDLLLLDVMMGRGAEGIMIARKLGKAMNEITKEPPPAERVHQVVGGDTLSKLAKKYYGSANKYMDIFNANQDQLKDPNLIKVGQKLKMPAA